MDEPISHLAATSSCIPRSCDVRGVAGGDRSPARALLSILGRNIRLAGRVTPQPLCFIQRRSAADARCTGARRAINARRTRPASARPRRNGRPAAEPPVERPKTPTQTARRRPVVRRAFWIVRKRRPDRAVSEATSGAASDGRRSVAAGRPSGLRATARRPAEAPVSAEY